MTPTIDWLYQPEITNIHRLPHTSDHQPYHKEPGDLRQSLDGTWKVRTGKGSALATEWEQGTWQDITVPGHLQLQGIGTPQYTNTLYPWDGWEDLRPPQVPANNQRHDYKTTFTPRQKGQTILTFHGVDNAFYLYVNGQFAGYNTNSFSPAAFDITPFLKDGENEIEVSVFQYSSTSWLEDQDKWRLTGIFRSVELFYPPTSHIRDITIRQQLTKDLTEASLKIEADITNPEGTTLQAQLYHNKEKVGEGTHLHLQAPALWTEETPNLYDLHLTLEKDGRILEQVDQPVGIRTITIEDAILKLNHKPLKIKGINRHDFHPAYGHAVPDTILESDMRWIKSHNINAVRNSHYPSRKHWYDLADQTGMLLVDETNLETHGSWQKLGITEPSWNIPGNDGHWWPAISDRLEAMICRNKNHPSIVIWSLGNEAFSGTMMEKLYQHAKMLDPTRPIHYEGSWWSPDHKHTTDIHSRMYAKPEEVAQDLAQIQDKPFLQCEYAHAMGNSLGSLDEYLQFETHPRYAGGFVWDYADMALYKDGKLSCGGDFDDFGNDGNFCANGILTADRQETAKSAQLTQLYRHVDLQPTEEGAAITNHHRHKNLAGTRLTARQQTNGHTILEQTIHPQLEAGSTCTIPIPWQEAAAGLDTRTLILEENGIRTAYGQTHTWNPPETKKEPAEIIEGDGAFTITTPAYKAYIHKQKGWQALYTEKQWFKSPVTPLFVRAWTDNDIGAGLDKTMSIWQAVQAGMRLESITKTDNHLDLVYHLPHLDGTSILGLDFFQDHIHITLDTDVPQAPVCHGLLVCLKKQKEAQFLARGPEETYADRKDLPITLFAETEASMPYIRPQEHGLHTDTFSLRIQDIRIQAADQPFYASLTGWTPAQLQTADHKDQLPQTGHSVLRILSAMAGVGGDDSWGAPIHEAYMPTTDDLHLSFDLLIEED